MTMPRQPSAGSSTAGASSTPDAMDIDSAPTSRKTSLTAPSIHEAAGADTRAVHLANLQAQLHGLRLSAQRELNLQPKSTQLALRKQTSSIISAYGKHGSASRLSLSVKNYFADEKSTKGLRFWSPDEALERKQAADTRMAQLRILAAAQTIQRAAQKRAAVHQALLPSHDIPGSDPNDSPLDGRRTTTNDEETTSVIRDLDFHPASIVLTLPSNLSLPPTLLPTINRILHILNLQANTRLQGYVDKYITLHPTPAKTQHGYALLRLGLLEHYTELVSHLFGTADSHPMELSQAQRSLLREFFERLAGTLTETERGLLADATDLDEEIVEEWWRGMTRALRARKAMAAWIKARELELIRKAKLEGRY